MRIALRTGGGRGVYELAGRQGTYRASELFDKEMFYELTPNLIVPGRAVPGIRQEKPRIKLVDQSITTHLYRLLAGLLLLPKPKREFKTTSGEVLIAFEAYSMTVIKIDVGIVEAHKSIVRPTEILLENYQGHRESLSFIDRMARIMDVWRAADEHESELSCLLRDHKKKIYAENIDHKEVEKAAKGIFKFLDTKYDPLQYIENLLNIEQADALEELSPIASTMNLTPTQEFGIQDTISPEMARIESIRRWRKVAVRGSAAIRFRANIKEIYRDTCLFTGQRLPKLESISSAGIDAAHILPWADFKVNTVDNGICLSKQCHWAFDSGVLKLSFDNSVNQYIVSIPSAVLLEAKEHQFSLEAFQSIEGPIPIERLPKDTDYWPKPEYLDAYNTIMYPK